jgi:hypothetical protein
MRSVRDPEPVQVDDEFVIRPKRELRLRAIPEQTMVIGVIAVVLLVLLVVLVVTW